MKAEMISVIVPVYKVEQYLDRCVSSIVNQTYRNLEILLIDDGSPDNCPQMCDAWKERDSRIKVIHKENAGLGEARNTGIENATGDYICFFDSDDYVALETIELAWAKAKEETADFVVFGMSKVSSSGNVIASQIPNPLRTVYCGADVQQQFLPEFLGPDPKTGRNAYVPASAWSCMISVDLIRRINWRFASEREIISEDIYSMMALMKDIQKAVVLKKALYYYCVNDESLTRSYHPDRYLRIKDFYQKCLSLCSECGYSDAVIRRCMEPFLANTIGAMKQEAVHYKKRAEARNGIKQIIDDELLQRVLWEKKRDKTGRKRKLLFWAIRRKCYWMCYVLLAARTATKE